MNYYLKIVIELVRLVHEIVQILDENTHLTRKQKTRLNIREHEVNKALSDLPPEEEEG